MRTALFWVITQRIADVSVQLITTASTWPMKFGPIGSPKTSVKSHHYSLYNDPEERRPSTIQSAWSVMMADVTTLSVTKTILRWFARGRKWPWPTVTQFFFTDWRKAWVTSFRRASLVTHIWTQDFSNTKQSSNHWTISSVKCHHHGECVWIRKETVVVWLHTSEDIHKM